MKNHLDIIVRIHFILCWKSLETNGKNICGKAVSINEGLCEKRQVNLINITTGTETRVSKLIFIRPICRYNNNWLKH